MKKQFQWVVVFGLVFLGISARAAPLALGDAVPVISAKDQFCQDFNSTNDVRFLLVATEMACAKVANLKLAGQGGDYLATNHAAYLMDIHTMPAIGRFFALPKMRKYAYRIVLVETADTLAAFPVQPGRVTVLALTPAGRIRKITFWDPDREPVSGYLR